MNFCCGPCRNILLLPLGCPLIRGKMPGSRMPIMQNQVHSIYGSPSLLPNGWMDNVRGRMGFVGSPADTFLCKTCPISPHPMVCYRLTGIPAGHPPPLWTVTAPTAILPANTSRNSFLPDASIPLLQLCWQMLLCCLIPKRRPGGWRK